MLQATGVEEMYPYLDFTADEEGEEYSYDEFEDEGFRNYLDDDREEWDYLLAKNQR